MQGVAVDQTPSAGAALTQVVGMMQAHPAPWGAVALQPAHMQVQVTDAALRFVLVIFVEPFWQGGAAGALYTWTGSWDVVDGMLLLAI